MAGYAVECLLKTKLMKMFQCVDLTELENELQRRGILGSKATIFTHQLETLLKQTGNWNRLRHDPALWSVMTLVNGLTPSWRYHSQRTQETEALEFLSAADRLLLWIEANT